MLKEKTEMHLTNLLSEMKNSESMVIINLFALGCYLKAIGEKRAGYMACTTALEDIEGLYKYAYLEIMKESDTSPIDIGMRINPNAEIDDLLEILRDSSENS